MPPLAGACRFSARSGGDTLDTPIEHGHDRNALRGGFPGMFVHEPGTPLDLTLDAAILVDAEAHRARKAHSPRFSIDDRLADMVAPVLLVGGDRDGVVSPDRQLEMARKPPRSKAVIFSGEGDMLAIERPVAAIARKDQKA